MLPAVAVREFVTRHAAIMNADYKAPSGQAIGTTDHAAWRLDARRPTTPVHLMRRCLVWGQHIFDPV